MLAAPDPQPLLRIYADGRVHVHYPAYMKRAGEYTMNLDATTLDSLVQQLADNGLMDFDAATTRQQTRQLEATRRAASGELYYRSDGSDTVIDIRLAEYRPAAGAAAIRPFRKQVRWRDLEQQARRYPQAVGLVRAAAAAASLRALCEHPALQRLP